MAKVSILIPIYNVEKYLEQCLDSVVNQTLRDIEIICINDGSTDSSLDIIKRYAEHDPRFVIIDKPNGGYGHSMNAGLRKACGEYIGIVESDDYAELHMFETLYQAATEHQVDVVKSDFYLYYSIPETKNEKFNVFPEKACHQTISPIEFISIFDKKPSIWSALYNRQFLNDNNIDFLETPGASYQDASFNFKVWINARRVYLFHEAFLHYRQDNENASVNSKNKVYCVCDEYREMQRYIDLDQRLFDMFDGILHKIKFDTYMWNYNRLGEEFKLEFLQTMVTEFLTLREEGRLHRVLFDEERWLFMNQIIDDPIMFHKKRTTSSINTTNENGSSISKGFQYLKQHGIKKTIKKVAEKI